ncbi:MAG: EpsG family protein [Sphingomonadaceae bacterium]|nr:EpsG family protein [Sphingomonadaceae bacterium]MCP5390583.1 EpsG family protein [Sphingomonadaceae bacterium]MCP5392778.1 EpsG family protein [Sphingomonadaceae bacterium]
MWPYLALGGVLTSLAIFRLRNQSTSFAWGIVFVLLVLFVGLRHHVGMDWSNYLRMLHDVRVSASWSEALIVAEPFYAILLAFGDWTGGGIYLVNLISTAIALGGIFRFARKTPEPWLALLAAFPFLIVVICMSANRQAIAAGIIMMAAASWYRISVVSKCLIILLAAQFHQSALLFFVFVVLELGIPIAAKVVAVAITSVAAVYFLQTTAIGDYYLQSYAGTGEGEQIEAAGAWIHVLMNALPAAFYFAMPKSRKLIFPVPLLRNLAFAAMATFPMVFIASAAAGRISIYWFPVSIYVWAALPGTLPVRQQALVRLAICALQMTTLLGWLYLANTSSAHIPYSNALFVEPWNLDISTSR